MLAADKNQLVAGVRKRALEIREKELRFFVERYPNRATQASVVAGFAFAGLVELEVPEECDSVPQFFQGANNTMDPESIFVWTGGVCAATSFYYVFDAMAMAFALYTVCVASFCVVYGHRLALQGPQGSVQRSVAVMVKQRRGLYTAFGASMLSLVLAGVMMAWVKMGQAAMLVTLIFFAFFTILVYKFRQILKLFAIPESEKVTGEVRLVGDEHGEVDLAALNADGSAGGLATTLGATPRSDAAPSSSDAAATPRSTVGALAALRHASSKSAVALSAKSGKTDDGSVLLAGSGAPLPRSREGSLLERLGAGLGLSAKEPP